MEKILKTVTIVMEILSKLKEISQLLFEMQKKTNGSVNAAILASIGSVAAGITALNAAIVLPEPVTKTAAIVSGIVAVAAALFAIQNVLDVIESKNEEKNLEKEHARLEKLYDELKSELASLKRQMGL